jgi:hypothetical protein
MRLYVNSTNEWFGNQDDANAAKLPYELCVVPDDKKGLIQFLNNYKALTEVDEMYREPTATADDVVLLPWKEERDAKLKLGVVRKQVICYLEYSPSSDEVTDVRMVSSETLAADNWAAWSKLDRELSSEREGS